MTNQRLLIACCTIGVWTVAGCVSPDRISDVNVKVLQQYEDLTSMMNNPRRRAVLVDVRSPQQFAEGHIPDAINIRIADLRTGDARLSRAKNIVVYANELTERLSRAAVKKLLKLGYQNVYDFQGGLGLWRANHGPVTTE